jgi:hypothetical protein
MSQTTDEGPAPMNAPPFPDPFRSALAPAWTRRKDDASEATSPLSCDAPQAAAPDGAVRLFDATPVQCRFPVAGSGLDLMVCGDRKRLGRVYCAAHCQIAYIPRKVP